MVQWFVVSRVDLLAASLPPGAWGPLVGVTRFETVFPLAREWAGRRHAEAGQTWGDGKPYLAHLDSVVEVLRRFGFSDAGNPVHQVLWLGALSHDLVEDTGLALADLRVLLGPEVARLVWALSEESGTGAARAERHAVAYPRIAATPWAVVLKVADRISNVEASIAFGPSKKLRMYQAEHSAFRAALYQDPPVPTEWDAIAGGGGGMWVRAMWAHLDHLLDRTPAPASEALESPTGSGVAVQRALFE